MSILQEVECARFVITVEDIKYFIERAESEIRPAAREAYLKLVDSLQDTLVVLQMGPTSKRADALVNLLHLKTGASILECKKALYFSKDDVDEAIEYLIHMNPNSAEETYTSALEQLEMETRNEEPQSQETEV